MAINEDVLQHIHEKRAENPYTQQVGFRHNGGNEHIADINSSDAELEAIMNETWFSEEDDVEMVSNQLALQTQRGGY